MTKQELKKPTKPILTIILVLASIIVYALFTAYNNQYSKKENNFISGYKVKETKYNDNAQSIELEFNAEGFNK